MATQLASGYIELTVKSGKAMGEIKKDLLGLDKVAKKAGTDAGKSLSIGLNKGVKPGTQAKGYFNPFVRAGRTAGADAGKALSRGFNSSVDISTSSMKSSLSGFSSFAGSEGKQAGSKFGDNFAASAKAKLSSGGKGLLEGISGGAESAMGSAGALAGGSFLAGMAPKIMALGSKAGPIGIALTAAVGLAAAAGAVVGDQFMKGVERQAQRNEIKAKVGLDDAQAAAVFRQAEIAYTNNFGASIKENVETATQLIQAGLAKAGDAGLNKMVGQVSTVAQITGASAQEVIAATNSMVNSGIVKNVGEAMDVLIKGQQEGLNQSGDLLDTFNEYSGQFKKIGLSAGTALGLVNQLMKGGARNSDIAADAIKEFSIRAVDGSEQTNKAFDDLGFDWQQVSANFAAGGDVAQEQFSKITQAVSQIQDPLKKAQIQVALFGTQAEDLGPALDHLDPTTAANSLGEVAGAAQKASDALASGPTEGFKKLGRQVEVAKGQFQDMLVNALGPMAAKFADLIQQHLPELIRLFGKILSVGIDMAKGILDFVGDITIAIGELVGGFGNVHGAVLRTMAAVKRALGHGDEADELDKQADSAFGWGESIKEAGHKIKDAVPGLDKYKDQVTETADEIANATEVSNKLGDSIEVMPDKKTVKLTVPAAPAVLKKLKDLGYTTKNLPDGTVEVIAETEEAQGHMDSWRRQQTGEPLPIKPTVDQKAADEYKKKLQEMVGNVPIPMGVPPPGVQPHGSGPGREDPGGYQGNPGSFHSSGLMPNALSLGSELAARFPNMEIGGKRADPHPDHPSGKALDVMVGDNPQGKALGDRLFGRYLGDPRVKSIIWQQTYYEPSGYSKKMSSTGNRTGDHYDHLHVLTKRKGGGIPGYGGGDAIPALLEAGEHVFDKDDVRAMGGQNEVYRFRKMLSAGMNPFLFGGMVSRFSTGGQVLDWDALAKAEASGNWANTSNTDTPKCWGGLQFDDATWAQYGGTGHASDHTREEQIAMGIKALNSRGSPKSLWPNTWQNLGWRPDGGPVVANSTASSSTPTKGVTAEQRSTAQANAAQAQNDLDVAVAQREEMAKDKAYTTEAIEDRNKRLAAKDAEIAALKRARDDAKATSARLGSLPAGDEEDPVIAAEEDARQQQLILEQEQAKLADLKKSGAVQSEIIKQQGVIDQQQIKVNDAQAAIATAWTESAKETASANSSFNSENPYMMIMEGLKKIIPDPTKLADIAAGGIKETFLPPGFSDPQDWGVSKIASGLLGFIGGLIPGPAGYVLRGLGSGVGGDAGGMVSELMGGFLPAPFGDVPWEVGPDGQTRTGIPGMTEEQFAASRHGSTPGALPPPGSAPVPVVGGVGTGPAPGPVDNSIHIGDVNRGDGAAVVQKASNQQATNTRRDFGTRRVI